MHKDGYDASTKRNHTVFERRRGMSLACENVVLATCSPGVLLAKPTREVVSKERSGLEKLAWCRARTRAI
jgi:hypothetical protein